MQKSLSFYCSTSKPQGFFKLFWLMRYFDDHLYVTFQEQLMEHNSIWTLIVISRTLVHRFHHDIKQRITRVRLWWSLTGNEVKIWSSWGQDVFLNMFFCSVYFLVNLSISWSSWTFCLNSQESRTSSGFCYPWRTGGETPSMLNKERTGFLIAHPHWSNRGDCLSITQLSGN